MVADLFSYGEFIPFLHDFLKNDTTVPDRAHYTIPTKTKVDATLLTMPAWRENEYVGVKVVHVFPDNTITPTINGSYILSSGQTGECLAIIDGLALTLKRTASVSAVASSILAPKIAKSLLMIGTGNLCHELIQAHTTVRPIQEVWIWGRNHAKAIEKSQSLDLPKVKIKAVENKEAYIPRANMISCATLSDTPLIHGKYLSDNVYLDLVGSFKKESREADDDSIMNANIYVDTMHAKQESGDIYIPIQKTTITERDIIADLTQICRTENLHKNLPYEKTFFKSVGFAAPDLAAAIYLYQKLK